MKKLQVILDESQQKELDQAVTFLKVGSKGAAIRRAVRLVNVLAEAEENGGKIIIEEKDGTRTRILIF